MKDSAPYMPKKGDYFTVVQWTSHRDYSYVGDCLEAVAVDQDLVLARRHPVDWIGKINLSGQRCIFRPLSLEYVSEVISNRK